MFFSQQEPLIDKKRSSLKELFYGGALGQT